MTKNVDISTCLTQQLPVGSNWRAPGIFSLNGLTSILLLYRN